MTNRNKNNYNKSNKIELKIIQYQTAIPVQQSQTRCITLKDTTLKD